jgi:hypothetical protein
MLVSLSWCCGAAGQTVGARQEQAAQMKALRKVHNFRMKGIAVWFIWRASCAAGRCNGHSHPAGLQFA